MTKYFLIVSLLLLNASAYGSLAGGRPNAFSEGQNGLAGVVNPANAVWIKDRIDFGAFWVYQKSSLKNYDNNRFFPPGKTDFTYKSNHIFTADAAIHKQFKLNIGSRTFDSSISLAFFTLPSVVKVRTKDPLPLAGTTPVIVRYRTDVISVVFSLKLNCSHSIGFSIDHFTFSHRRDGYENSDNPLRSVSPGNVTNRGNDHSNGFGCSFGWRWRITENLNFGAAWTRKSYCGQYRKYRGFEPHHAKNYTPQTVGAGFSYRFTPRFAGRVEVVWLHLGNIPYANNNVLSDGRLNLNKRGSKKSPGPGLNDATLINIGIGYKINSMLSVGASYSHRLKFSRKSRNVLSHTYRLQTIYDILALGANFNYEKHDVFIGFSYGFKNHESGLLPLALGGGRIAGEKRNVSLSISWGYQFN